MFPARPLGDRLLCESDVDGFPSLAPDFSVYCPLEGRKLRTGSHALCEYFAGYLYCVTGEEVGVRCGCPQHRESSV
jgi:hypothetical protein